MSHHPVDDLDLDLIASDLVAAAVSVASGLVVAIGTDLVELDRFRTTLDRTPTIVDRLFTDGEQVYARARNDPTERFAVRFAAKEAVMKAMGVGIGEVVFRDIEVVRADSGEPSIVLHGSALQRAEELGIERVLLTMTHSAASAVAFVVAVGASPS